MNIGPPCSKKRRVRQIFQNLDSKVSNPTGIWRSRVHGAIDWVLHGTSLNTACMLGQFNQTGIRLGRYKTSLMRGIKPADLWGLYPIAATLRQKYEPLQWYRRVNPKHGPTLTALAQLIKTHVYFISSSNSWTPLYCMRSWELVYVF